MRKTTIKNFGTINIEQLEVSNGQLEIFIPVEVISDELDAVLERLTEDFRKRHPEVENVAYNIRLVFTFGYANPEFELLVTIFNDSDLDTFEEYDSVFIGDIELPEEQRKQIKKVVWNKLGETLLNL